MKEILIRVADKLPKVVSMAGTAVRDNRYRLTFEFDDEWQDGLKTYIIADSRGHFVPYPSEENHIDVELGGSHVINVGVMQDILATSRPCQIFLEESIRQKMKDEIPPPEPDVWTYITEQIRILAAEKLSPVQKAEDMTQEVGVDPNGRLWTNPGSGGITQETDPTVPAWAKQKTKPSYTASEVGAFSEEAGSELGNYVYRLFLATYAQTTFAEIRSAHRRERHVLLRHPDIGTMPMAACTVEGAVFFTVNEFGTIRIAHVNINDDWYVKIIKPEMTENRENTLSNSATNYPSSYAVTQAIAALNTVSSLVFDTIEEMDQYIAEFGDRLKVGQSLYIRASDVPDYWWDGTAALPMESGGSGQPGADGFSPSASVEQTDDGAVITITDKDGTTTATITNGQDGQPGEKGDPGNDYVLTDADKQEIAGMIPGGGGGSGTQVQSDWDQNDPAAADYVRNRTHYAEVTCEVPEQEFTFAVNADDRLFVDIPLSGSVRFGQNVIVNFDGVEYQLFLGSDGGYDDLPYTFGNLISWWTGGAEVGNGLPFAAFINESDNGYVLSLFPQSYKTSATFSARFIEYTPIPKEYMVSFIDVIDLVAVGMPSIAYNDDEQYASIDFPFSMDVNSALRHSIKKGTVRCKMKIRGAVHDVFMHFDEIPENDDGTYAYVLHGMCGGYIIELVSHTEVVELAILKFSDMG